MDNIKRHLCTYLSCLLLIAVVMPTRVTYSSVDLKNSTLALSSYFKLGGKTLADLKDVKKQWETVQTDSIPTKEELAAHIATLKVRITDKQRIADNVKAVEKVISRIRQDLNKNADEFSESKDLVDVWINSKMRETVLSLLENGVLVMAKAGKIDPLMQLRTYPGQKLDEEPKHPFVYATNSANPPQWGHVSAALMAMIESGSSKIAVYTGWSSGAGAKPGLAPLDLRLKSNDMLAELFGDLMVHIKDLSYFDPSGEGKDEGKSISGSSPVKVFSLNESVETMVIAKGMDHSDDIPKLADYTRKHGFDTEKISFVFCPRKEEDKELFDEFTEAGKDFKSITYRPNLTMWASSTKVRKGETQALVPNCIRSEWQNFLKGVVTTGRFKDGKSSVAVTGATGDIASQFAHAVKEHADKTSFLTRKESLAKLEDKKIVGKEDKIFASSLFNTASLKEMVSTSDSIVHSAAILDRPNDTLEQQAETLAVNAFATGFVSEAVRKVSPNTRMLYVSSQMVYSVKDNEGVTSWLDNAYNAFYEYAQNRNLFSSDTTDDFSDDIMAFAQEFLKSNPVPKNENLYALTKLLGERFAAGTKDYCIGRVTNIYGPGYKGQRNVYRIIDARLKGIERGFSDSERDYVYVDDLNEAMIKLLDEPDISNLRVVDFAGGNIVRTYDIAETVAELTPLHYGKNRVASASKYVRKDKKYISPLPRPSDQKDIRGVLPRPLMSFKDGLSETIRSIQMDNDIYDLRWKEQIYKFVFEGEECVGRLYGSSSGYLLLIKNKEGNVVVRKIAVSQGVHGNGTGKLEAEINHSHYIQNKKDLKDLSDVYVPILNSGKSGDAVWCDMPYVSPGENVMKAFYKHADLSEDKFYELFEELLSEVVPSGYLFRKEELSSEKGDAQLDKLYLQRALTRVSDLFADTSEIDFFHDLPSENLREEFLKDKISINGKNYENPVSILERFAAKDELRKVLRPKTNGFCVHGDLTFLNMVYDRKDDRFKLIDSRGFVGQWDPLYDFGKLLFSLTGFYNIVNDSYTVEQHSEAGFIVGTRGELAAEIKSRKIAERFLDFLETSPSFAPLRENEPNWKERILFGAGIHYIADIPFRLRSDKSVKAASACYLIGTVLLNKAADIIENNNKEALKKPDTLLWQDSKAKTLIGNSLQTYFYEDSALFDTTENNIFDPDMMRIKGGLVIDLDQAKPDPYFLKEIQQLLAKGVRIAVVGNKDYFNTHFKNKTDDGLNNNFISVSSADKIPALWSDADKRHVLIVGNLKEDAYSKMLDSFPGYAVNSTHTPWDGFAQTNIVQFKKNGHNLKRLMRYLSRRISEKGMSLLLRDDLYENTYEGEVGTEIAAGILEKTNYRKQGTVIAVDGPTASGKSTITDNLYSYLTKDMGMASENVNLIRLDWFLKERPVRNELFENAVSDRLDVSGYSYGAWDYEAYYDLLQQIKNIHQSGRAQTITIKSPYNRVTGKRDGDDITFTVNPKSTVIVEGTDTVDNISRNYFDATVHLDIDSDAILADRLLEREKIKPETKRMDEAFILKRFWSVDHPHAEHIRERNAGVYDFVINNSDFKNVVFHSRISDSTKQFIDSRMNFLITLAERIGKIEEIDLVKRNAVVKTESGEYVSLDVGGKTAVDISKVNFERGRLVKVDKSVALSHYIKEKNIAGENVIYWGDNTEEGHNDAKVLDSKKTSRATLIGVRAVEKGKVNKAVFDATKLPGMKEKDIVTADRTQETLRILWKCYQQAKGAGRHRRRNAVNAFFDKIGVDRRCNEKSDVALGFDIDYTLICNSRIDPESKESFDGERKELAQLLRNLWKEDFNIVFITANSKEVSLERVLKPLQKALSGDTLHNELDLYANNNTLHTSLDPNGAIIDDTKYSKDFSISDVTYKDIMSALGKVKELPSGEIITEGLIGDYYDLFTDNSRRLKDVPAFPLNKGFLETHYPGYLFSLLNISENGNFNFLNPEIRGTSYGVSQITLTGLPSNAFFAEKNMHADKHYLLKDISKLLFALKSKTKTPEAYETETSNMGQFYDEEINNMKKILRSPYFDMLIGAESKQLKMINNRTLRVLLAASTKSDAVLLKLKTFSEQDTLPLTKLLAYVLSQRFSKLASAASAVSA